jgi:HAMP domain-containing protein/putative methionine-R-sulfoxide reductase with GAF domain
MKFKFTISNKLILGFGVVTVAIFINSILINRTLNRSVEVSDRISEIYEPSANYLVQLSDLILNSKMLIKNWVFIEKKEGTPDKLKLAEIHDITYPEIYHELSILAKNWDPEERATLNRLDAAIRDTLFKQHQYIMNTLDNFDAYSDPFILFDITPRVEESGEVIVITDRIIKELHQLTRIQQQKVELAREEMADSFNRLENIIFLMGGLLVIISLLTALFLSRAIINPVSRIRSILQQMSKGILPRKKIKETNDEIGDMAAALNDVVKGLNRTTKFSVEIGKGNFDSTFTPLSDDDDLGNALLEMRDSLKAAKEEETRRKQEDEQRNWASQGIAKFSDLLRQNNDDMDELTYSLISNLVKYTGANQGGLFVINEESRETIIELKAAYAFNKKKILQKQIEPGVGLVGRAVQENETIFLTDIPNDYINITSGLGEENPRSLLIVPLKVNEEVYGAVELASFQEFQKYQIEFIERIGENIASTLSTVKVNIRTQKLLSQTQQQAQEMKEQEEEMRQNMEELQATQEESARREAEMEQKLKEYEATKKRQEEMLKKLTGNKLSGNWVDDKEED